MVFQWQASFECSQCGAIEKAAVGEYDALGYRRCPSCGARSGPGPTVGGNVGTTH